MHNPLVVGVQSSRYLPTYSVPTVLKPYYLTQGNIVRKWNEQRHVAHELTAAKHWLQLSNQTYLEYPGKQITPDLVQSKLSFFPVVLAGHMGNREKKSNAHAALALGGDKSDKSGLACITVFIVHFSPSDAFFYYIFLFFTYLEGGKTGRDFCKVQTEQVTNIFDQVIIVKYTHIKSLYLKHTVASK